MIELVFRRDFDYRRDRVKREAFAVQKRLSLFIFSAAISLGINASGQTVHKPVHRTTSTYSSVSFSGTVTPHFMGNDLRRICDALSSSISSHKGEFETTAEYQAEVRDAIDKPIIGDIKAGSDLAFVIPSPLHNHLDELDEGYLTTVYNADHAKMTVQLHTSMTFQPGEPDDIKSLLARPKDIHSVAIIWGANEPAYRSWNASNSFGASVKVKEQSYDAYGLAIDVEHVPWKKDNLVTFISEGGSVEFSVPIEEARLIKGRLKVLIVCRIKDNPIMSGTDYHKATMTSPFEKKARYKYLHITPVSLWVFDDETGKVYLTLDGDLLDQLKVI
jgi:hypothetical protein